MGTQKLDEYSSGVVVDYVEAARKSARQASSSLHLISTSSREFGWGRLDATVAEQLLAIFQADLDTKTFQNDADRSIVHGIVQGYLLVRQLRDAVLDQLPSAVDRLLGELQAAGLKECLHHAVDSSHDT